MKVKELKQWLSLIDNDEDVKIHAALTTDLASISFSDGVVYLCGHNYGCDDEKITATNVLSYLQQKK